MTPEAALADVAGIGPFFAVTTGARPDWTPLADLLAGAGLAAQVAATGAALGDRAGRPVELTRKEFGVLEVLLAARGGVVSSEELLDRVWDENADPFTTTVRVTVMTLRRKLGEPGLVDTVVGAGYRVPAAAGDAAAAG